MPYTDIAQSASGDNTSTFVDFSVATKSTDAATGSKETMWINTKASQYLGYYKTIPELKIAIDAKATWTIGKGFTSGDLTTLLLSTIKGTGVDTFNSILENAIREFHIYGDAFVEVIRNEEGKLINLKPLDPAVVKIYANSSGIITKYEIMSKVKDGKPKMLYPENMVHLARNRIADEIHGTSIIDSVEWIILARNEAMTDFKTMLHRNIYPVRVWHLETDNVNKIANFKAKVAKSKYLGEDIFIPKGSVETEIAAIPANSTLNPMPWIQLLNQYFFQTLGVPQIIIGGSMELTQTAAQISYLAFEQTIEEEQLYIEEQVLSQLNLEIELDFPASLQNNMMSDLKKDEELNTNINQPNRMSPPMMRQESGVQEGEQQ